VSIAFGWGARNGWITGRRILIRDAALGLFDDSVGLVVVDGAGDRHGVAIGDGGQIVGRGDRRDDAVQYDRGGEARGVVGIERRGGGCRFK